MDNLFFRLTADKTLKRNIQLLKLLTLNNSAVISIDEIAQSMGISRETVISDIEILKERLPAGIQIVREKWVGVRLIWKKEISIEHYIAIMAKETVAYKIIDSIFHGNKKNLPEWERELFISNTTLRKNLKYFNRTLKEFRLKIAAYTVELLGEEVDIRYFYYVFYKEFRDLFVVQIKDSNYTEIITDLRNSNLLQCSYGYFPATLWLMIARERIKNKKHVVLNKGIVDIISKRESYQVSQQISSQVFEQYFQIVDLPTDERVWIYITSLHCIEYNIIENTSAVLMREEEPEILEEIKGFLENNIQEFKIDAAKYNDYIYAHQALLVNMKLLTQVTPLFQQCSLQLKKYTIEVHPDLYGIWLRILKQAQADNIFDFCYIDDLSVLLTILTVSFLAEQSPKVKQILLSFRGDLCFSSYLAVIAKMIIPDNIECTFISEALIDQNVLDQSDADLFISNYNDGILTKNCRQLELSTIPTMAEWAAVRNYILDLDALDTYKGPYQKF